MNKFFQQIKKNLYWRLNPRRLEILLLGWLYQRKFRKWLKFVAKHKLYPVNITEEYLKQYIDL